MKQSVRCAVESCSSASEFWKFVKSRSKSKQCVNRTSTDEWKLYFDHLLNSESVVDDEFKANIEEYMSWHDGNCNVCNSDQYYVYSKSGRNCPTSMFYIKHV